MTAETLLDNLTTALVCLDDALVVSRINPAGEFLFGVSARHCRARAVTDVLPCLAAHAPRLRAALADRAGYTEREMRLQRLHGQALTVDCSVTPFATDQGGQALLLEFVARDRQQRIRHDDAMRSRNLANREMLRGLAHEIKNPLGGLRGAAQLLERETREPGHKEFTAVIIREADRLRSLVDSMLGPRRPPLRENLNLHEPLEHVRALSAADVASGMAIERDYDPSLPEMAGDREQLVQVFLNLVGNAAAALAEGGHDGAPPRITLRTRAQRLFTMGGVQHRLVARVDIIDNGPGISPDLLPHIFHPLVSARARGTGLGLPIAQDLLQRNGGLLACDSRPGHTAFSVFLPLRDAGKRERS